MFHEIGVLGFGFGVLSGCALKSASPFFATVFWYCTIGIHTVVMSGCVSSFKSSLRLKLNTPFRQGIFKSLENCPRESSIKNPIIFDDCYCTLK